MKLLFTFLAVVWAIPSFYAESGQWLWHSHASSVAGDCQNCDWFDYTASNFSESTTHCTTHFGSPSTVGEKSDLMNRFKCLSFSYQTAAAPSSHSIASKFATKLGDHGILMFVGDSNIRKVFEAFLKLFGQTSFMHSLENQFPKDAKVNLRSLIHHTYLCPKQFDLSVGNVVLAKNVTVGFIWNPILSNMKAYWQKRPWSQCGGCDFSAGVRNCDHSAEHLSEMRWACGRVDLDIDNIVGGDTTMRNLLVYSHGAAHDIYHRYQCRRPKVEDDFNDIQTSMTTLFEAYMNMDTIERQLINDNTSYKYACAGVQQFRGKEIMLSPFAFKKSVKLVPEVLELYDNVIRCADIMYRSQKSILNKADAHNRFRDRKNRIVHAIDRWVNVYNLTSTTAGAPWTLDGLHYPLIGYVAILEAAMKEYVDI